MQQLFPGYFVYPNGQVYSYRLDSMLKQSSQRGYKYVTLYVDGVRKTMQVHRLVALCYLEPVEGKNTVDHIDRNRENNNVDNLRWADYKEQAANRCDDCCDGLKRAAANYRDSVKTKVTINGVVYESQRAARRALGRSSTWVREHSEEYRHIKRNRSKRNA